MYYPGAEAAVRYAQLLKAKVATKKRARWRRSCSMARALAPAHYRRAQKPWLEQARRLAER